MTDNGLVSVIMPVYNGADTLFVAVDSVLSQTYTDFELIIIDDGSTDGSADVIKDIKNRKNSAAIKYFYQKNAGAAAARNRGISEASGRYIAFMDCDDIWESDKLATQIEYMKEEPCVFCFGACNIIDESGKPIGKIRRAKSIVDFKDMLYDNLIPCLTVVIDREGLGEGLSFPAIRHEDYALWLSILKGDLTDGKPVSAHGIDKVLGSYRVAAGSLSGNKLKAAGWHYRVYREYLKLGAFESARLFIGYSIRSIIKRI